MEMKAERAEVEAKLSFDGSIRPLAFMWRGRSMKVMSWGRQWEKQGRRHFLVMTARDRVWELRFMPATMTWSVHEKSNTRRVA